MDRDGQLRLTLTPAPKQNQIAGVLFDEAGYERPFRSWLGLLSLLEAARGRTASRDTNGRQTTPKSARQHQRVF
jgi:hypothetical protein